MRLTAIAAPVLARLMARFAAGHPPHPCLARALAFPDIHVAQTLDEREAVYRFWYRIYVDIMGKQPAGADHRRRMIVDDLTPTATLIVATVGGKIVGTVRSLHLGDGPVPQRLHDWLALERLQTRFRRDQIAINGKVMVDPAWRGSPITSVLAAYLYCYRRQLGILADTGWCAPALVPWFSRMGYRRYTENFVDPDVGLRVPVMMPMADVGYLRRVHSPLFWCASNYPSRPADGRWFETGFPRGPGLRDERATPDFVRWQAMCQFPQALQASLFHRLTNAEIRQLQRASVTLLCRAGMPVLRRQDRGEACFVVASGQAQVCTPNLGRALPTQLGPGDVVGLATALDASPREVDVTATTDLLLWVFGRSSLMRLAAQVPRFGDTLATASRVPQGR